jgi:hypothetical protein
MSYQLILIVEKLAYILNTGLGEFLGLGARFGRHDKSLHMKSLSML